MTTKPAAPKLSAKQTPEQKFWEHILEIQKIVGDKAYGVNAGKGGSTLKDSNTLRMDAHKLFNERGITYDVLADDITLTIDSGNTFVTGYYVDNWFLNGELVYSSKRFAGFDTPISASTNVNYAVQGAMTSATTIILFSMLKANTQSEEDLQAKREQHMNRQTPRTPVQAQGGGSYY
jgi:hypothetical protein